MLVVLRDIATNQPDLVDAISLEAIEGVVSQETVKAVVAETGVKETRRRKLPAHVVIFLVIAMNLYTHVALNQVLRKLVAGLRFLHFLALESPDEEAALLASKGAISQARYRVGAAPMVTLFHRVCQPMATEETPGAFLFGLRLMAIDGTHEDVADTPENARTFGRPGGGRGEGAFPQVMGVYLVEVGTHAIVDAGVWPGHAGERTGGLRLLRSVGAGMLVMWDRGFHSFDMAARSRQQGADFLGRVPAHAHFKPLELLPDGSYLAYMYPSEPTRRKAGEHMPVRIIDYTLDDPNLPGYGERHRLVTSLLEHEQAPARELACAYHERWEIEITIDEIDTHQRLLDRPLRSLKPVGVIQEFYGLLIAHYVVRTIMHDAALQAEIDPDRLSFTQALHLICDAIPEFQMVPPARRPALYQRLLRDIAGQCLPERDHRSQPRVVKRKMSKFAKKRPEHRQSLRPSMPFRDAVRMLDLHPQVFLVSLQTDSMPQLLTVSQYALN